MAKVYWRTIKRGARTFASIPEEMKPEVIQLAKADVLAKIITKEEFKRLIGVEYTD